MSEGTVKGVKKTAVETLGEAALQAALEEAIHDWEERLETPLGEPTAEKQEDYGVGWGDFVVLGASGLTATLPLADRAHAGRIIPVKNLHATADMTVEASGSDTIDGSTTAKTLPAGHCYGYYCLSDGKWVELWRPELAKIKFTREGGIAVLLPNDTGAASVRGTVVESSDDVYRGFKVAVADCIDMDGVVYEDGVADGEDCWVVISGYADALLEDGTDGTLDNWVGISTTQDGRIVANVASPPNQARHFQECGHCKQTTTGAGNNVLCGINLHWN